MTQSQSTWTKPSTESLLRASVLVFWLMLGVQIFAAPPPDSEGTLVPHSLFFAITAYMAFGLAFWFNTRNIAFQSLSWRPILLLGYQAACGFVISTDLLYIVAAEIPLAVPARAASIWITVQTLLLTLWIFWLDQTGRGHLEFLPLPQLPHLVVIVLTDIGVFAIHGFAFFMGYLAASEARGRRVAERLNAELIATQDLLAQSSRIAERAYVARELHDTLGHHLVALKVNLELAAHLVTKSPARAPLQDALSLVKHLLSEVREVVGKVRAKPKMELRPVIETLLAGITEFSVELVFPPAFEIADPAYAHVLFRCVQEAVTNAIKHARANKLRIEFGNEQHEITLVVSDDGIGVSRLVPGHGLNGMRERLESVGGSLDIDYEAGHGFTLLARLPKPEGQPQ